MKPADPAQQPSGGPRAIRVRPVRAWGVIPVVAVLLAFGAVSRSSADPRTDGSALFEKHCFSCHPQGLAAMTYRDLLDSVRTPPVGMPAFDERKLSDAEVRAIRQHLAPAAQTETAAADRTVQKPPSDDPGTGRSSGSRRTLKERKAWLRGFGTQ